MVGRVVNITRGDSCCITAQVLDEVSQEVYYLSDEDVLYFGVMDSNQKFEDAVIKKRLTKDNMAEDGTIMIPISPSDSIDLIPGVYWYTLKLHNIKKAAKIDRVETIVANTKFIIND